MHAGSLLESNHGRTRRPIGGGVCGFAVALAALATLATLPATGQDLAPPDEPIEIVGIQGAVRMTEVKRIHLDEAKEYLATISSADFLDDGSFVVASANVAKVVLYNADGSQRRVLAGWGLGPNEYKRPALARAVGSTIYVRDDEQHKYMAIDSTGRVIGEWYGHPSGPDDFVVSGSWIIGLQGQSFEYLIQGFDMNSADTLRAAPTDMVVSASHVVDGAGNFGLEANRIHFAYPTENAFQTYDLSDGSVASTPLPTLGYKRDEFPFNDYDDINRALVDNRLFEYSLRNSRVEGVHVLDDFIVVLRSDGEYPQESQVPSNRLRNRKFFVYDHDLNLLDTIVVNLDLMRVFGIREHAVHGNSIYYIIQSSSDGGRTVGWTLFQLEIQRR